MRAKSFVRDGSYLAAPQFIVGSQGAMKQSSITNVILGLSIFILALLVVFSLSDHRRRINEIVMIKANLKALASGARYVMQEHDTNEVTYNDIIEANIIPFTIDSILGEDYTSFDVNTNDTSVEISIPGGTVVSIEFDPLNK